VPNANHVICLLRTRLFAPRTKYAAFISRHAISSPISLELYSLRNIASLLISDVCELIKREILRPDPDGKTNPSNALWAILTQFQSLSRVSLTKSNDFFKDAITGGVAITGSGQMIYWKDCTVKVFKSGQTDTVIAQIQKCDGQALVKKGTSLLLEEGLVKVEEE
jgi:hypothetical protein